MTKIPITKNQADAIRADLTEIGQMQQMLQMRGISNKRMMDMIIRDGNQNPENFANYGLEEKNGQFFLVLKPNEQQINGMAMNDAKDDVKDPEIETVKQ